MGWTKKDVFVTYLQCLLLRADHAEQSITSNIVKHVPRRHCNVVPAGNEIVLLPAFFCTNVNAKTKNIHAWLGATAKASILGIFRLLRYLKTRSYSANAASPSFSSDVLESRMS